MAYIFTAYVVMAYIGMAYIAMSCIVMAPYVLAYIAMAWPIYRVGAEREHMAGGKGLDWTAGLSSRLINAIYMP